MRLASEELRRYFTIGSGYLVVDLLTAVAFGWMQRGTRAPEDLPADLARKWAGDYGYSEMQTIEPEDAQALADALDRAVAALRAGTFKALASQPLMVGPRFGTSKVERETPKLITPAEQLTVADAAAIERLAAFLREGAPILLVPDNDMSRRGWEIGPRGIFPPAAVVAARAARMASAA